MKKAVLIGCGAISENHLAILHEMPEVDLTAVCDISPEAARQALSREGISLPIYTDYKEMLEKEKPDAVHICTPHFLHAEMAIYALDRGVNVFLEKPACMTPEELPLLEAAVERSCAILCVSFQNRFLSAVEKAKEVLKDPGTGKILGGRAIVTWMRNGAYYTESPWRGRIATEGGSVLINQSIHSLDLLLQFLGDPDSVQGAIGTYATAPHNDTEDTAHIYMTFPDGKSGVFFATNNYCKTTSAQIDIVCENKTLSLAADRLFIDRQLVFEGKRGRILGKAAWGKGHGILIDAFYRALEEGGKSPVPLESAARSLKVIWEVYRQNRA